jgi:hypothetical protein
MKILLFVFYLSLHHLAFGQFNMVQNPSFETCSNCPNIANFAGEIGFQSNPNIIINGWTNPNISTPDYFHLLNSNLQIPDGNSFIGICAFASIFTQEFSQYINAREYIMNQLFDTLIIKRKYLIEFFTKVSNGGGNFASNNLGVYFSDSALSSTNIYNFPLDPQVKYFNNEIIQDTIYWTKFSGIFESLGGEKFMTVGNFNSHSATDYVCFSPFWPADGRGFYFLDKFSVTPLDSIPGGLQVNAGLDHDICIGDTVFIGEKISNLPANWYLLDGTVVDTNTAGVYVHPTVTTTYVVTMTINGVSSSDTVTVNVGCLGIDELEKQKFTIYPVPNDGDFFLKGQFTQSQIITVKTSEGKIVYSIRVEKNTELQTIHTSLESGVYFVLIEDESNHLLSQNKFIVFN